MRYVKKSHIASQLSSKLKAHVETRWNSVHDMLVSIIENYDELYLLLETKQESSRSSNALDKISCLSVIEMKAMVHVLAFFKQVTMVLGGGLLWFLPFYLNATNIFCNWSVFSWNRKKKRWRERTSENIGIVLWKKLVCVLNVFFIKLNDKIYRAWCELIKIHCL